MAKPDNRADNEAHLQDHIDHTFANLREAEDYLDEHSDDITTDEKQAIEAKNDRRKASIKGLIEEKKTKLDGKSITLSAFHTHAAPSC